MNNFNIILFKNKKRKKIFKSYSTEKNALIKYEKLLVESKPIDFEVFFENGDRVNYEIGLVSYNHDYQHSLFKIDELGRNTSVFVDGDSNFSILRISDYKIEELIYDWQSNKRIPFKTFLKLYCGSSNLKIMSTLHNKIVIQDDDKFYIFSLKNSEDSYRFLETVQSYYINNKMSDFIFVRDMDTTQRKWMYKTLENHGFDRKKLYRQYTTFSK